MKLEEIEARFLNDIARHKMEIKKDDGIYRHIRFSREGSCVYRFDLITWPGHLCYTGDMGTYVFSRINDMFDFFIMDKNDFNNDKNKKLNVNPGYWTQKALSKDKYHEIEEYSSELFEEAIKEYFDSYFEDEENEVEKNECWEEIKNDVLFYSEESEETAMKKATDFEYNGFEFEDFWENDVKDYTFHYIWGLYAIVWGILQYKNNNTEKTKEVTP